MEAADAFVVDASVAVKWHLRDESYVEEALGLLRRFVDGEIDLIAPDHIRYEVPNAITIATRRSPARLTPVQGQEAVAEFLGLRLTTFSDDALLFAAYALSAETGCAFYDAAYAALARRTDRALVTADARLYSQIRQSAPAIWLGDSTALG